MMVCSDPRVRDWSDQVAGNRRCKAIRNVHRLLRITFSVIAYVLVLTSKEHATGQRKAELKLSASRSMFLDRQVSKSSIAVRCKTYGGSVPSS
jgi:hypothetical protein